MKLYAENGTVYFDYTDVDTEAGLDGKAIDYRRFMRETMFWDDTELKQVVRLAYHPFEGATEYGNEQKLSGMLGKCRVQAKYNSIEIDESFTEFIEQNRKRCEELRAVEVAKEEAARAKREWEDKCKYGCGRCEYKRRCEDDYVCAASGDILPEENKPCDYGKVHYLFNSVAFPTDSCPFNIDKKKAV